MSDTDNYNAAPTLLIVDDTYSNLFALQAMLENEDIEVKEATNGSEAITKARDHDLFLILMDVNMPIMNGFEAATKLRGYEETAHIPVIFVTAHHSDEEIALEGYAAGAVDYIHKPINSTALLSKIAIFKKIWIQNQRLKEINEAQAMINAKLIETTQALKRSNQELEDFAAVASHDLNSPLTVIMGYANRLMKKYGDQLDENASMMLSSIVKSSSRMSALINSLLEYAAAGNKKMNFALVDLQSVATDVVSDCQSRIEKVNGTVQIDPLPCLEADSSQIYQLFLNVIGNALKFHQTNVSPMVRVSGKKIVIKGVEFCEISIADNGIGFDIKKLDEILTPFHRLVEQEAFEGTGIGMGTVRKIVENFGGSITAKSEVGVGSTFIVSLPLKQKNNPLVKD